MSSGQANYKGVNSQAWAAMSLFLQYLRDKNFSNIALEAKNLQDFTLNFGDDHKIICESKDRKDNFSYADLKKILGNLKQKDIGNQDEILIVCTKLDNDLLKHVENFKYWHYLPNLQKKFRNKGFTKKMLKMLPKVKFWKILSQDNHKIVYALFGELVGSWLPQEELENKADGILIKKIYEGSAIGDTFTRNEIIEEIADIKKRAIKYSGYFDKDRVEIEIQLREILDAINDNQHPMWSESQLKAISAQPSVMFFVLDRFKKIESKIDDLSKWGQFWKLNRVYGFSFNMFDIFEKNLHTKGNRKYILALLKENFGELRGFFYHDWFDSDAIKIIDKIIEKDHSTVSLAFEIISKIITDKIPHLLLNNPDHDKKYIREEAAKTFNKIFDLANSRLKIQIFKFLLDNFSFIDDSGDFWHSTPFQIYEIVKKQALSSDDLENNFKALVCAISDQYQKEYTKLGGKDKFKGWDLSGSGISQMGSSFTISDRNFVGLILQPILKQYYESDRDKTWKFITRELISREEKLVTKERPDFLNRAVINIVLGEFALEENKQEAKDILCDFIKMKRGIPHKTEMIFQDVRNSSILEDKDKWELVKFSLDKYKGLPINVFVEQITSSLAEKGHHEAISTIIGWSSNPDYLKRQTIGSFHIAENVAKLLSTKGTYDSGINSLLNYIRQDGFTKVDNFDVYDLSKLLTKIIEEKTKKGLSILQELYSSEILSPNDQTLIVSSIEKITEEKESVILEVYDKFIYPNFEKLDKHGVEDKFTVRHIREQFIHYVEKLAKIGEFEKATWLLEKFIDDSDPPKDGSNYQDDKKGDFNHHKKLEEGSDESMITTVRGWCGQSLSSLAVAGNQSGMHEVIQIARTLSQDPNHYVRYETCISLRHIVANRRTYMPGNKKITFLTLEDSQQVEDIVFDMLHDKRNHKVRAIMKRLVDVFGGMRGISEDEAMDFLNIVLDTKDDEVIDEAIPLFVYFAEFREKDYKGEAIKAIYVDKWESIKVFRSAKFKKLLDDLAKNGSRQVKARIAWQFWQLPEEQKENKEFIEISLKYFDKLIKSGYEHETFEHIYHFFEEWLEKYPKECLALWKKCLAQEGPAIKKLSENKTDFDRYYWFPFYYNGKILVKLAETEGNQEFLRYFEFLLDYPKETSIPMDVNLAVDHLVEIKTDQKIVERIFNKLMERNPNFYESKKKWQLKIKKKAAVK